MPGRKGVPNLVRTGKEDGHLEFEQGYLASFQRPSSGASCSSRDTHSFVVFGHRWLLQRLQGLDIDRHALRLAKER